MSPFLPPKFNSMMKWLTRFFVDLKVKFNFLNGFLVVFSFHFPSEGYRVFDNKRFHELLINGIRNECFCYVLF